MCKIQIGQNGTKNGWGQLINSELPDFFAKLVLTDFSGLTRTFGLFYNLTVKEVHSSIRMFGKAAIVGDHANGRAFAVQLL
jgi:hypothetical protein